MAVDCDDVFGNSLAELQVKHCYRRTLQGHKLWDTVKGGGQGSLACCSLWGRRESDMLGTEQQNESVYRWKLKSSEASQLETLPQDGFNQACARVRGVPLLQTTRRLPLGVTVLCGQHPRRLGSTVISIDPLPPGQPGDVGVGRACTGLCISCLFLVRVQAWRHLDRWGLDSRELTLQEITGARALFGALPPTLGTSQSTWRIQGQLVSQPQGPMERAVCISRAPRAQDVACAVRTARVPRTWHARCVLRMRRAFWVEGKVLKDVRN